jgi:hydrogenase maturation protease
LKTSIKILVYGYGNPGREDDGLGNAFVSRLESWASDNSMENISFDSNYQLNIEDAEKISNYDLVIFADASTEEIEDYIITRVDGKRDVSFTTHSASPGYVVYLCNDLFGNKPATYLLHIRGYQWEFREGLSKKGEANLYKVLEFFKSVFKDTMEISQIESLDKKFNLKK